MSKRRRTFLERALAGEVLDVDKELTEQIAAWHQSPSDEGELHEYLGFAWDEYAFYVECPSLLQAILMARRNGIPLPVAIQAARGDVALAARGVPSEQLPEIREWLQRTGRL
jgi:hypothetical protein